VTPIIVGDKHLGNLFYGQFLYEDEEIDYEVFREQARRYGYDEEKYIKALKKVPRKSKAFVENVMKFFAEFADMIANLGYTNLRLARALKENKEVQMKLRNSQISLIRTISKLLSTRDSYTMLHQERVSKLAVEIAKKMSISSSSVEGIKTAGLVLDIGKMNVPSDILNKSSKLTEIEFELIKEHTVMGYGILKSISFGYPIADIVLQHHERMDGSGYPNNLKGEEISIEARILAVADVIDAMVSHRPYRPAHSIDEALEYILHNSNKLFDPEVVFTCLELFNEGFSF
jgi:HD-GYP domain-containing protein (c-di-GMP phosphodiesterase class II)